MPQHQHASAGSHRFAIGRIVRLNRATSPNAVSGQYEVTATLPECDGEPRYRIKSDREIHERVAGENQLESCGSAEQEGFWK